VKLLFGGRSKDDLPGLDDFKKLKIDIKISTQDGSVGKKGLVTELLKSELRTPNSELRTVYACGPKEMLKEVARIAEKADAPCYVSLDNVMVCGIGACLGCAVKSRAQSSELRVQRLKGLKSPLSTLHSESYYKMVCKDGPVFDAREIEWEAI
jgi:dihydroorotate dehydrogenase electron transfer subunit